MVLPSLLLPPALCVLPAGLSLSVLAGGVASRVHLLLIWIDPPPLQSTCTALPHACNAGTDCRLPKNEHPGNALVFISKKKCGVVGGNRHERDLTPTGTCKT